MEPTKKTSELIKKLVLSLVAKGWVDSDWADEELFEALAWLMGQHNMEKSMEDWKEEKADG